MMPERWCKQMQIPRDKKILAEAAAIRLNDFCFRKWKIIRIKGWLAKHRMKERNFRSHQYNLPCGSLPAMDRSILPLQRRHWWLTENQSSDNHTNISTCMPKLPCNIPEVVPNSLKLFSFPKCQAKESVVNLKHLNQVNVTKSYRCCPV